MGRGVTHRHGVDDLIRMGRDLGMAAMEGYTEVKNVYVGE